MAKIIKFRIAIFTIFIISSYLLSAIYQDLIGFILVLSVGLIHGANDLLIIKKNSKNTSNFSQFRTFFTYISVVFIGLIFFYLFPSFALITFILVSIYHFGEQHLEAIPINKSLKNNSRIISIVSHGIILFTIIFLNNIDIVNNVFLSFKINFLNSKTLNVILITASILYISTLVFNQYLTSFIFSEVLFFVLFYFLSLSSTLILCFSVYFIFFIVYYQ